MTEERERMLEKIVAAQNEHALKVGQATLAWIHFHIYFRLWFSVLITQDGNLTPALREWDLINADANQRKQKLRPQLEKWRDKAPEAVSAVEWVCDWADQLALIRNAFVHSVVVFGGLPDNVRVQFDEQLHLTDEEDRYRMVKKKPDESFNALMEDLANLQEFLHRTFNALTDPKQWKYPPRPELATAKLFPDLAKKITS
jgi:hypothetical protein